MNYAHSTTTIYEYDYNKKIDYYTNIKNNDDNGKTHRT